MSAPRKHDKKDEKGDYKKEPTGIAATPADTLKSKIVVLSSEEVIPELHVVIPVGPKGRPPALGVELRQRIDNYLMPIGNDWLMSPDLMKSNVVIDEICFYSLPIPVPKFYQSFNNFNYGSLDRAIAISNHEVVFCFTKNVLRFDVDTKQLTDYNSKNKQASEHKERSNYSLSPDNVQLSFLSEDKFNKKHVYVLDLATGNLRHVFNNVANAFFMTNQDMLLEYDDRYVRMNLATRKKTEYFLPKMREYLPSSDGKYLIARLADNNSSVAVFALENHTKPAGVNAAPVVVQAMGSADLHGGVNNIRFLYDSEVGFIVHVRPGGAWCFTPGSQMRGFVKIGESNPDKVEVQNGRIDTYSVDHKKSVLQVARYTNVREHILQLVEVLGEQVQFPNELIDLVTGYAFDLKYSPQMFRAVSPPPAMTDVVPSRRFVEIRKQMDAIDARLTLFKSDFGAKASEWVNDLHQVALDPDSKKLNWPTHQITNAMHVLLRDFMAYDREQFNETEWKALESASRDLMEVDGQPGDKIAQDSVVFSLKRWLDRVLGERLSDEFWFHVKQYNAEGVKAAFTQKLAELKTEYAATYVDPNALLSIVKKDIFNFILFNMTEHHDTEEIAMKRARREFYGKVAEIKDTQIDKIVNSFPNFRTQMIDYYKQQNESTNNPIAAKTKTVNHFQKEFDVNRKCIDDFLKEHIEKENAAGLFSTKRWFG